MEPMRRVGLGVAVACCLASTPAQSQVELPQPQPPDDREWKELSETEDPPEAEEEEEDASRPSAGAANPYRQSNQPTPIDEPEPDDGDRGSDYSESVAWMVQWVPRSGISHASLEYELFSTEVGAMHTWDAVLQLAFGEPDAYGALHVDLPWGYLSTNDTASIANPVLGGQGGAKLHDQIALWGGFKIAFPTVTASSDPDRAQVVAAGAVVRALAEAHRWALFAVPLRLNLGAEFQIHPLVYFRLEADPMVLVPTEGQDAEVVMDQINELEALSPIGLGGGARFQGVYLFTSPGDKAQLALEPYIAYEPPFEGPFSLPLRARIGLLFALDAPLGLGFDPGKLMTLRTSIGARF